MKKKKRISLKVRKVGLQEQYDAKANQKGDRKKEINFFPLVPVHFMQTKHEFEHLG